MSNPESGTTPPTTYGFKCEPNCGETYEAPTSDAQEAWLLAEIDGWTMTAGVSEVFFVCPKCRGVSDVR